MTQIFFLVYYYSFYNYDSTGRYLTSISSSGGERTLYYAYNENGDLVNATGRFGASKIFSYNEKDWIEMIENYDCNTEFVSSTEYKISWSGKVDLITFPQNTSNTLMHDRLGQVVSVASNNGLPEISVELPTGRKRMVGDEVSMCK